MTPRRLLVVAAVAALGLVAPGARGGILDPLVPFTARIQELPPPPGFERSAAFGLNDRGQAVGIAFNVGEGNELIAERAVIWNNGRPTLQPLFAGTSDSRANTIDEVGRIGGRVGREDPFGFRGAMWVRGQLNLLPAIGPGDFTTVEEINNQGIAVGHSNDASGIDHPVFWVNGKPTFLNPLIGAAGGLALAINTRGQIVGISLDEAENATAVLWNRNQAAALALPPDLAAESAANDINDPGVIVGEASATEGGDPLPVIWRGGFPSILPTPPGTLAGTASSVNNPGLVVGEVFIDDGVDQFFAPALWAGSDVIDLQELLPLGSGWEEIVVPDQADVLNSRNQLVGFGVRNGQVRAFLMTLTRVL